MGQPASMHFLRLTSGTAENLTGGAMDILECLSPYFMDLIVIIINKAAQ